MKLRRLSAVLGALALTFSATSAVLATAPVGHKVPHLSRQFGREGSVRRRKRRISPRWATSATRPGTPDTADDGVWYPGAKADEFNWGDIIPPYDYQPDRWTPNFQLRRPELDRSRPGRSSTTVATTSSTTPGIHVEKTASVDDPAGGRRLGDLHVRRHEHGQCPADQRRRLATTSARPSPTSAATRMTTSKLDLTESWTFSCTGDHHRGHDQHRRPRPVMTATPRSPTMTPRPLSSCGQPAARHRPDIHLDKTVLPLTLPAGGGDVTYTYVVSNIGRREPLAGVAVTDDNGTPGDTSDDFGVDCPKTTLDVGESMTCTADVSGTTKTTTNIATASGTAGETTVSDTDDATVTVAAPAAASRPRPTSRAWSPHPRRTPSVATPVIPATRCRSC